MQFRFKKIYIEITNNCNLSCPFCSHSNRPVNELSIENVKEILHKIKGYTKFIYLHIKGEPLTHSNITEIIQIAHSMGFSINVTTNGTLLSTFNNVQSWPVRQWNISLHAYEYCTKYNINILMETVKKIHDAGDVLIAFRLWTQSNDQNKTSFDNESIQKIAKTFDLTIEDCYGSSHLKIKERLYLNRDIEFEWPSLHGKIISKHGSCHGLKTHIGILSDGTVVPCCLDGEGVINLGNIFNNTLEEIITDTRATTYLTELSSYRLSEDLCKRCSYRSRFYSGHL